MQRVDLQDASSIYANIQADRRLRPLARRRLITLRPPTDDMRARKPWVRFRFTLEGWNVRFTAFSPLTGWPAAREGAAWIRFGLPASYCKEL